MNNQRVKTAIEFARQIIPWAIDPYALCEEVGIDVVLDRRTHKDGYLVCTSGCRIIFVSSDITNLHRRKFIVSHELGHFLMHREQLFCCDRIWETAALNTINTVDQEHEANEFASEYLMPRLDLQKMIPNRSLCFADISKIAQFFDVSMTLSAIKSVQLSNTEDEILICYQNDALKWFVSADKTLQLQQIPSRCPINHIRNGSINVTGMWDSLYEGNVKQEVFCPVASQKLILISRQRYTEEPNQLS